ncbi:MAG TPA: site-2 protease family protein, partial [Bryobacteraceae bacterium]|nr:site-2 protease family protein [Bryobacteraceae bacterium]
DSAILNVSLLWLLTTPHEFAHAWVATRLGDDTPQREGRVSLNPMMHVDWLGTVILPAITSLMGAGFLGWGRPVNTNPSKLRWGLNGLAMVALAGPVSNVIFAVVLAAAAMVGVHFWPAFAQFAAQGVRLSLYLAIFNLLPVPPLDGSKLLLAARIPWVVYQELARAGFLLLVLAMAGTNLGTWMSVWSFEGAERIFGLFP